MAAWEGSSQQINLLPGAYTITVVDQNNCSETTSIDLIEPPTGLVLSAEAVDYNGVQITCNGANDGAINTDVEDGVPPYTYVWTNSAEETISNEESLSNLEPGDYTVTVTDANDCPVDATISIIEPEELILTADAVEHAGGFEITCSGADDGEINTTIQGGVLPYTYTWTYEGEPIPDTSDATDLTGLQPGEYTVTVTDANDCPEETFTITLIEPEEISITATNVFEIEYSGFGVSCLGACDGAINTLADGGVPAYNYIWTFQGEEMTQWEGLSQLNNLCPGEYTVTAVDQNGCDESTNIDLVEPPTGITFSANAVDQNGVEITCNGANDGEINTSAEGGVPPYTYTWTYEDEPIPNTNDAADLTGLQPGDCLLYTSPSPRD